MKNQKTKPIPKQASLLDKITKPITDLWKRRSEVKKKDTTTKREITDHNWWEWV